MPNYITRIPEEYREEALAVLETVSMSSVIDANIIDGAAYVKEHPIEDSRVKAVKITVELVKESVPEKEKPIDPESYRKVLKNIMTLKEILKAGSINLIADTYPDWIEVTRGCRPCIYIRRLGVPGMCKSKSIKEALISLGFTVDKVTVPPKQRELLGFKQNELAIVLQNNKEIFRDD